MMPSSVLITGATGYVGIHVLSNLLRQENIDRILCVTRHKDQDSFWSAIESHVDKFKVAINVPDIKSKIEVVSIDLIQDHNLILPALEKYKQSVSAVHHLACDSTYGHPFEHFKPWVNVTKELIRYCMDSKYPKYFYATGSYGQYLADNPHATSEDYYWINGYFKYKRWMYHYVLAKMEEGLKGTLFQPGYIVAPIDPGQEYIFWRIARMFAALGYAFQYPMGFTPIDMLIDNYMLTLNHPDDSPKVISPCIPQFLYVDKAVQKLIPDLKVVEYEKFRDIIKKVMPKREKYFSPNLVRVIHTVIRMETFHPLYDNSKYTNDDVQDYLLTCQSLTEAVEQGLQDRQNYFNTKNQLGN